MKRIFTGITILSLVLHSDAFSQCTASVINIPHGNCEGTDIELIADPGSGGSDYSYMWTGPQGFTSTSQFVNIPYAPVSASGIYKVTITNGSSCSASDSVEIVKNANPIVYTGGDPGGCLGSTTYIYAEDFADDNGPYSYLWDNGQTSQNIAITHGGGTYPAPACRITNGNGCAAYNYTTFLIYTIATPDAPIIEATSATTFCKGGNVTLTTAADPDLTYQWKKSSGIVDGGTSNNYTTSIGGHFSVTVTNLFGCSSVSNKIIVKMILLPTASITVSGNLNICNGDSVFLQANTGSNFTYQWTKYKVPVSAATGLSYYAKVKGNYRVIVTNEFGCSRTSAMVAITSTCRDDEEAIASVKSGINVFPNPSSDIFNVEWQGFNENEGLQMTVSDLTGRVISKQSIENSLNTIEVGNDLKAGIYFIEMIQGDKRISQKIIKSE